MVTLEQKISLFKKLVDDKVSKEIEEEREQKLDEIRLYLENEQRVLMENANKTKKTAIERIKRQKSETLSTLTQRERKWYLKKNEEILRDMLQKVENRLKDFVHSEEYTAFIKSVLLSSLEVFSKDEQIMVYAAPMNFKSVRDTIKETLENNGYSKYIIKETELSCIGGFILQNESKTIRLNKTFAEAMYLKREDMGQLLHEYIQKEV